MNTKRVFLTLAVVLCLGIGGYLVLDSYTDKEPTVENGDNGDLFGKHLFVEAKYPYYENLAELEQATEEIVVAEKVSQADPSILYGSEGELVVEYTLSGFKVSKVISGDQLKAGSEFTLLENEVKNAKDGYIHHIGGYQMIKKGREYLLFLQHSETDPWYLLAGLNVGKVDLTSDETDYPESIRDFDTPVARDIKATYAEDEKLRQEAREKYARELE